MRTLILKDIIYPGSGKPRTLRILVPEGKGPYDVLYMHDGQNLFEDKTAYVGTSWGIPHTLDRLVDAGLITDLIVVGIDNSLARMTEYSLFPAVSGMIPGLDQNVGGKGLEYADFLIDSVIKTVESMFDVNQTHSGRMIAGSSMGALISAEIALIRPGIFSVVGCFSLASWFSEDAFLNLVNTSSINHSDRYFISVGRNETSDRSNPDFNRIYVENARLFKESLLKRGIHDVFYMENQEKHHESAWNDAFAHFMLWARKNR